MGKSGGKRRGAGRPVGSDREENLRRILDAALSAFAEKGYGGTHFAEIAATVGFTRSALYQYFPNKRALYLALLDDIQAEHAVTLQKILGSDQSYMEKLEAILDVFVADHEFDYNRSTFLAAVPLEFKRHPDLANDGRGEALVLDLLMSFFREGIEQGHLLDRFTPQDLCLAFLGGLLGMSLFQHSTGIGQVSAANRVIVAMLRGDLVSQGLRRPQTR